MSRFDDIGLPIEGKFKEKDPEGLLDLSPDEILRTRKPKVFVPTGWKPLDDRLRGAGIPAGSFCVLVGPPSAGKTYLSVQIALGMANCIPTLGLYADWGRDATTDVFAVMEGASRKDVDEKPKSVAPYLKTKIGRRVILLRDSFSPDGTIKSIFDLADTLFPCVVFLDSASTCVPGDIPELGESETGTLAYNRCVSRYIRHRCMDKGHICFITCEANRRFYSSKNASDNSAAISAASGGGIEYAADLMIAISRPDLGSPSRSIELAKNRMFNWQSGLQDTFQTRYTPYSTLEEITTEEATAENAAAIQNELRPIKLAIRKVLEDNPKSNQTTVVNQSKLIGKFGRDKIISTLDLMVRVDKTVVASDGPKNSLIYSLAYTPVP